MAAPLPGAGGVPTQATAAPAAAGAAAAGAAAGGTALEVARAKFDALRAAIDTETAGMESLNRVAERVGVARSSLVLGAAGFMFAFLFLGFGAQFFSHLLGMAFPVYASFKAIESRDTADDTQWLTYWVVFGCFSMVECFVDTVLFWFPFYFAFKVGALLFLQAPQLRGAEFIYRRFLQPMFLKHAPAIEARVAHVRDVSQTVFRNAGIDLTPTAAAAAAMAAAAAASELPTLPTDELFGGSATSSASGAAGAKKTA